MDPEDPDGVQVDHLHLPVRRAGPARGKWIRSRTRRGFFFKKFVQPRPIQISFIFCSISQFKIGSRADHINHEKSLNVML